MKSFNDLVGQKVYFIGIGGISMSGLAKVLHNRGVIVFGSDIGSNFQIDKLKNMGITVYNKHLSSNITNDIDLVVYTGAIDDNNAELQEALRLGIATMERSQFLGIFASGYENVIAISGTHGKTTTTAMIGYIFHKAGYNPTIHIGGESNNFDSNIVIGGNKYLILEACEYRESFKYLNPTTAIITNIEKEHLDYYVTFDNMKMAFQNFAKSSQKVFTNESIDNDNVTKIDDICNVKDIQIINNLTSFKFVYKGKNLGEFKLNILGKFNVNNAIFAICTALNYGINVKTIKEALFEFSGVKRRYENIGKIGKCDVIIDYAHHPTEIRNSISGIMEYYSNILIVFQPHTYSRTVTLWREFLDTFIGVDNIIFYPTYPAREKEIMGGRAIDLYNAINSKNKIYINNIDDLMILLNNNCKICRYDCVLILGAGDLADKVKIILN